MIGYSPRRIIKIMSVNTTCKTYNLFRFVSIYEGPPIILSTKIATENGVAITVKFYSTSNIKRPVWFSMSELISDTTGVNITIDNTTLALPVHNREIKCKGYVAKMSIVIFKNMKYTVLLKNEFGDTRKTFELHSGKLSTYAYCKSILILFLDS